MTASKSGYRALSQSEPTPAGGSYGVCLPAVHVLLRLDAYYIHTPVRRSEYELLANILQA